MVPTRLLALSVSLSILAAGLVGLASSHFETARPPVPVSDGLRTPEGARVLVRGLLGDIKKVGTGAALSTISDCAGSQAAVFFEQAPPASLSWRLVTLDATLKLYRGSPEFVVGRPGAAAAVAEAATVVDATLLAQNWRAFLCIPVAVHAPVLWANAADESGRSIDIGLGTDRGDLQVLAHADVYLEVTLNPGADVTFIGVVAASQDGRFPVIHVRV